MNSVTLGSVPLPTEQKRGSLIARYPIVSAILLTYLLTWAVLIPDALASQHLIAFRMPQWIGFLAGWGPAVAAMIVTAAAEGRQGVTALLKRFLIARVGWQWYLVALFGMAAMLLGGIGLSMLAGGATPVIPAARFPLVSVAIGFVLAIVLGAVFNTEEVLWRGFMTPRLQARHTALGAAMLIAIPESILHLPYFLNRDVAFYQNIGPIAFTLFTVVLTVLFAWLFNSTRGSLLIVTLAHASQNAWASLLSDNQPTPFYFTVALLAVAAVLVIVVFGARRLTRETPAPETGLQV